MQTFSDDRDILKYEPELFLNMYMQSQILSDGENATLSGNTLTKAGEDFISSGVKAGNVIFLNSTSLGATEILEIVSVDSTNQLTVSKLRPSTQDNPISPNADAADYTYRVATFAPQGRDVFFQLTQYYGIRPGNPNSDYSSEDLLDAEVLRQVSTFAIIASVYASKAAGLELEDACWDKSYHYRKKFQRARARCRLDIDLGKDGVKDLTRFANNPKLLRD